MSAFLTVAEVAGAGVYVDLLRLTQERAATLDGLAGRLREAGAPADAR